MKIGARVIKTGIAVAMTMFFCKYLGLEPAFFGAVSAVINMQPSIFLTLRAARDQILIHILGVVAGFFIGYFLGVNPLSAGLIVILLIPIYIKLRLHSGITMGIVAALFVLSSSTEEFLFHALARTGVIFVGLGSAMLVNVLLWPPRYNKLLKEKLRQSNEASVLYFCRAVQDYVGLDGKEFCIDEEQRNRVYKLNKEARMLLDLLSRERHVVADSAEHKEWIYLAEKLIDYNESIIKKGDRIFDILPTRLERRIKSGVPPISDEFRAILDILESGCTIVIRLNGKLRSVIADGGTAEPEKISEDYWDSLTKAIDQWQPRLKDSYYLHGLLEVALTANEIKWATRQAKKLLYESVENR
ncbi:FUSC family protein [Sporomusa malonica]|uniref:Aromatic acid exporter family member 1 n=1 Tax=Sporomusa malonica TaxID=112901 RepID=A0A1W2DES6_9FIRM|nr:aromatic acid exporter family protein [Sporomusa malonica]SMC95468.1 Aromatic acid exporter family member 1 [Sporomusa malonica]